MGRFAVRRDVWNRDVVARSCCTLAALVQFGALSCVVACVRTYGCSLASAGPRFVRWFLVVTAAPLVLVCVRVGNGRTWRR